MTAKHDERSKGIKELGWRQGSILPPDLAVRVVETFDQTQEAYVVISHDCDVTNASLENEPMVELLHAKLIGERRDGALLYGKHPRCIHFEVQTGGQVHFAEANAHDRLFAPRELLLESAPDTTQRCSRLTIRQISDWMSRRYVRSAFPDVFNDRIRPAQPHIKKALSAQGQDISGLFVVMETWAELPDDEPYRIIVVALMIHEDYKNPAKRHRAQIPLDKIEQRLNACKGIEAEAMLADEGDVSLSEYRLMSRLDFDYLSLGDEDGDVAPRL